MSDQTDQLRTDYKRAFASAEGKAVLRDLARYCNVMVPLTTKYPEPHTISYAEGQRAVFWHIFGMVHDPKPETTEHEEGFKPIVDAFQDLRKEKT